MTAPNLPGMVTITGLYPQKSKKGRLYYTGQWHETKVYLMLNEEGGEPAFWLSVKEDDYSPAGTPATQSGRTSRGRAMT